MLGIEVISFGYVKVRNYILCRLRLEHISIEEDIMIVLVVAPLLEVINNCHFRRVVFQHQLCRDAWHKRTTQTQCGQIYKFAANRTT